MKNKTRSDAYCRISDARQGCMLGTTPAYREALREFLYAWIAALEIHTAVCDQIEENERNPF